MHKGFGGSGGNLRAQMGRFIGLTENSRAYIPGIWWLDRDFISILLDLLAHNCNFSGFPSPFLHLLPAYSYVQCQMPDRDRLVSLSYMDIPLCYAYR